MSEKHLDPMIENSSLYFELAFRSHIVRLLFRGALIKTNMTRQMEPNICKMEPTKEPKMEPARETKKEPKRESESGADKGAEKWSR